MPSRPSSGSSSSWAEGNRDPADQATPEEDVYLWWVGCHGEAGPLPYAAEVAAILGGGGVVVPDGRLAAEGAMQHPGPDHPPVALFY